MTDQAAALRRRLNLPLLILYGIGITVGAGIYVLIGAVATHAGRHAPLAFVLAAIVMALTVASYAELCRRFPVAAGEAAYVGAAFRSRWFSTLTGALMIAAGVIASAAVAIGAAGYIAQFVDWPRPLVIVGVVVGLGIVSAWGVLESVLLASLFTLIEVGGLAAIIAAAFHAGLPVGDALLLWPGFETSAWTGIAFASLLAFFAFIGFEDLTNMAEETRDPERTVPIAMAVTLVVTTALYVTVAAIAVAAVPLDRLGASEAPLALVYREVAGASAATISAIAIVATLNTIIAQVTMSTRVVYGMARQGNLPQILGRVNRATATPLLATALVIAAVLVLALWIPLERLAAFTSISSLFVFAMVNLSLIVIRFRERPSGSRRAWIGLLLPLLGLLSCLAMIASSVV